MDDFCLLDTNIASALWDELHENHVALRDRLKSLGEVAVCVSVVTLAEVEYGLRVAPEIDRERQQMVRGNMAAFIGSCGVLGIDRHVVEAYAELRSRLFRKYAPRDKRGRLKAKVVPDLWERVPDKLLGIQENDLWLASLAVERNYRLVTNDRMTHIVEVAGGDLRIELWL
jgi:tRNA(fMet)-specific endonuclease VapC